MVATAAMALRDLLVSGVRGETQALRGIQATLVLRVLQMLLVVRVRRVDLAIEAEMEFQVATACPVAMDQQDTTVGTERMDGMVSRVEMAKMAATARHFSRLITRTCQLRSRSFAASSLTGNAQTLARLRSTENLPTRADGRMRLS